MSQIYLKRCNRCGSVSELANTPNPPGWQSLADTMHGTLASIDFCPGCLSEMGIGDMIRAQVRDRAVGALKHLIPAELPDVRAALGFDEIVAQIEAGRYDEAFDSGDGINLAAAALDTKTEDDEIVDAELVS